MAVNYSPKISTDGLIFYLDAANTRSYPGSGTTWSDLSRGGSNGILTNGPTFNNENGGSIVFDGVDDFVSIPGTLTLTQATFVSWIRRNGSQNGYNGIIVSRGGTGGNTTGMNFNSLGVMLGYTWNDVPNTYAWNSNLIPPDITWCMVAVSINPTSAVAYLCTSSGITSATNNVTHASTTLAGLRVANDAIGFYRCFNGRISVAQIYNRALSSTEIAQNYNATKGRFGL
jgi:hypothetical protein